MGVGLLRGVFLGAGALATFGCGGDDGNDGPACGTLQAPDVFVLENVQPAPGSSVANAGIVHRFSIVGDVGVGELSGSYPAAHGAGQATPAFSWLYAPTATGIDYTSNAITWATAPANVVIDLPGFYQASDGCIYTFQNPVYSYAVTPP